MQHIGNKYVTRLSLDLYIKSMGFIKNIFMVFILLLLAISLISGALLAILFIALIVGIFFFKYRNKLGIEKFLLILSILFLLLPGTIRFYKSESGLGLRILPINYGLPTKKMMEEAKNKKIILGGCIVNPFAPKWSLVFYY